MPGILRDVEAGDRLVGIDRFLQRRRDIGQRQIRIHDGLVDAAADCWLSSFGSPETRLTMSLICSAVSGLSWPRPKVWPA